MRAEVQVGLLPAFGKKSLPGPDGTSAAGWVRRRQDGLYVDGSDLADVVSVEDINLS